MLFAGFVRQGDHRNGRSDSPCIGHVLAIFFIPIIPDSPSGFPGTYIGGEMAARNPISVLEDHAGYWLRFVSNHVSHAFTRRVEARGVTVAEWVLLRELFDARRTNPSQLADELGMSRGAISKLVERLCQKKLVARASSHGDRRYQTVELTAAGKRIVPVLAKLADENDREFFGHLRPEQKTRLLNVLRDIVRRHGWKDLAVN
jgi:DNA-binding MarR family transcriptional regulator